MKLVLILTFTFILFLLPCSAQENIPCPNIKIIAPQKVTIPGEVMTFTLSTSSNANKNLNLDYNWTVSAGTIINGQKTPVILVDTAGNSGVSVVATLEIKGLAKNCVNVVSGAGLIAAPPILTIHNCDEYGKPSKDDEFARLDPSVIALLNDNNSSAVIHIESKELRPRIPRIFNYLTKQRGIAKNRLIFAIKNSEVELTRVCVYPKERIEIDCDDCQVVKGEDLDSKKIKRTSQNRPFLNQQKPSPNCVTSDVFETVWLKCKNPAN